MVANHVLCQLSYTPPLADFEEYHLRDLVGLGGFELPTSPLSGVRSNQLSYRPAGPLPQNKGYKFSPVASIWFLQHRACNKIVKNRSDLSKLDRRNLDPEFRKAKDATFALHQVH